jgi:hypothetical protein
LLSANTFITGEKSLPFQMFRKRNVKYFPGNWRKSTRNIHDLEVAQSLSVLKWGTFWRESCGIYARTFQWWISMSRDYDHCRKASLLSILNELPGAIHPGGRASHNTNIFNASS